MDVGPKRDLVGDLTDSVRAAGLHMGLYHSLREWFNPLYLEDNANSCLDAKFPDEVLLPTLKEIVNQYKVCENRECSMFMQFIFCVYLLKEKSLQTIKSLYHVR